LSKGTNLWVQRVANGLIRRESTGSRRASLLVGSWHPNPNTKKKKNHTHQKTKKKKPTPHQTGFFRGPDKISELVHLGEDQVGGAGRKTKHNLENRRGQERGGNENSWMRWEPAAYGKRSQYK